MGAADAYISGVGQSEIGVRLSRSPLLLTLDAIREALTEAGLTLGQIDGSLAKIPAEAVAKLVIAYEPIWAIGTGEVATPADAQEMCAAIRGRISAVHDAETAASTRILYGGSVKPGNVAPIMAEPDVDGALVGGASLDADQFAQICRYREMPVA